MCIVNNIIICEMLNMSEVIIVEIDINLECIDTTGLLYIIKICNEKRTFLLGAIWVRLLYNVI